MLEMLKQFLIQTPGWVWVLLAFLIFRGVMARRPAKPAEAGNHLHNLHRLRPGRPGTALLAIDPALGTQPSFALCDLVLSGGSTGVFAGKFYSYYRAHRMLITQAVIPG
jgi:hypothetical protein